MSTESRLAAAGATGAQFVGFGTSRDDAFEYVSEPSHRINAVQLRSLDQRHCNRPVTRSAVAAIRPVISLLRPSPTFLIGVARPKKAGED